VATPIGDNIGNQKTVEGNAFEVARKVKREFYVCGYRIDLNAKTAEV
jgi:hypothetical protein